MDLSLFLLKVIMNWFSRLLKKTFRWCSSTVASPKIETSFVILDNHQATYQATLRLIKQGCRKIKMVAYNSSLHHMNERIRGYSDAMTEENLQEYICVEKVENQKEEMSTRMDEIIQKEETEAIVFATNTLSIAGLYAIQRNNIHIPDDLLVIGFDGNEAFDFFSPPITYIEQPLMDIGKKSGSCGSSAHQRFGTKNSG